MGLIIINYIVKIFTVLIGFIFVTGLFLPERVANQPMLKVMGVILIIWGVYRTIVYRIQLRRYRTDEKDDE